MSAAITIILAVSLLMVLVYYWIRSFAVSMTPEAAAETNDRLLEGAAQAARRRFAEGTADGERPRT